MSRIAIRTPSRLHFSLIDLNGGLGRIDGSAGLAIAQPEFRIIAQKANSVLINSNQYTVRAQEIVEKLKKKYNFPGISIEILSEIPAHYGFGSGTQISLGIAQVINELYNLKQSVQELAVAIGRGGTSGIGITAFEQGGFILDGGHKYPDQKSSFLPSSAAGKVTPPPLLIRCDFPDWDILIVTPDCNQISGEIEVNLFKTLCPQPEYTASRLSHLILMKMVPAIFEADLHSFCDAINQIQTFGWKRVEIDAQGAVLQSTIDFLLKNGALGAGVSSWGPAIFAFSETMDELYQHTKHFLRSNHGNCFITKADNFGASIE
jgi:beta-ribofuranosylaminobenzene 5'-phosphate synthase